jgi:hypothetical protein
MKTYCEYCEKELNRERGEYDHGCLDCHCCPKAQKIRDFKKELNLKTQALDMQKLISKEYKNVFCKVLNISNPENKLTPNDAEIILRQYIELIKSDKKDFKDHSPDTYLKLRSKITKLKHLLLLTDETLGDVEMNDLTKRQWLEFVKCFPEENR